MPSTRKPEEVEEPAITDETDNPDAAVAAEGAEPSASAPPVAEEPKKSPSFLGTFLKLSGYKKADVLSFSEERRTVVTKNGSKYLVSKSGKQLKILMGAVPPAAEEEAETEE